MDNGIRIAHITSGHAQSGAMFLDIINGIGCLKAARQVPPALVRVSGKVDSMLQMSGPIPPELKHYA